MEGLSHSALMREAIRLSIENIEQGGGPFAAIIARKGQIIARGVNSVTDDTDPTAHAEVNAIRAACEQLGDFKLQDCEIYTSCEPCPMCLGAIYWAGLDAIYYANTREDAAGFGFADDHLYHEMELSREERTIAFHRILDSEAIRAFEIWDQKPDKTIY